MEQLRRRIRPNREPESEPEVLPGASDSERDSSLAPQLKRIRLSVEDTADDMHVDGIDATSVTLKLDCAMPQSISPSGIANLICDTGLNQCGMIAHSRSPSSEVYSRSEQLEIWKAEVQRRALEEIRRYRQEVRNCELGKVICACPGF